MSTLSLHSAKQLLRKKKKQVKMGGFNRQATRSCGRFRAWSGEKGEHKDSNADGPQNRMGSLSSRGREKQSKCKRTGGEQRIFPPLQRVERLPKTPLGSIKRRGKSRRHYQGRSEELDGMHGAVR